MQRFYLIPLSYRNILFNEKVLEKCEQRRTNEGYYIPEQIYLNLVNKQLI